MFPAQRAAVRTHFPDEFLDSLVDGIVAKVKLGGDLLGLVGESHAALVVSVEGADELDVLLGPGADGGILGDNGAPEGYARYLFSADDTHDGVWQVGCEETGTER